MQQSKQEILKYCKLLYTNGLAIAHDGNVSVLLDDSSILITPTSVSKGDVTEDILAHLNMEGKQIDGAARPSSEALMHLACYHERSDIGAVVHAHPPYATAFACSRDAEDISTKILLPELLITTGIIGIVNYQPPGSNELALQTAEVIKHHNGALLKDHGVITVGEGLAQAYARMESIEHYCRIRFLAEARGNCDYLSADEVARLLAKHPHPNSDPITR